MPRRNFWLLATLTVVCLAFSMRSHRAAQIFSFAMNQVERRSLEPAGERKLLEGALGGMMEELGDQYSVYFRPQAAKELVQTLEQKFGGVGLQIELDPATKQLTVASPLFGAPAYEAGVRPHDRVLRIDGRSTQGLSLEDAADLLKGKPGTPVVLTVQHEGEPRPVEIRVVRAVVRVDTVVGDTRNPDGSWNYFLEGHPGVGYLRINAFAETTAKELRRALQQMQPEMRGLILDLRDDPGGWLTTAVDVCNLFIDSGVIVTTRRRDGSIKNTYTATAEGTFRDFPMAVLVNHYSASASEIVAACLQDHQRAVVVGQRTYGKGTVQEVIELEGGEGALKLTTASYWRPSGKNIHRVKGTTEADDWGVMPDKGYEVVVEGEDFTKLHLWRFRRDGYKPPGGEPPPTEADQSLDNDKQLLKAVEYIEQQIGGKP